jgi:hypothetical protein
MQTYIVSNGTDHAHVRTMASVMTEAERLNAGGAVAIWERFPDGMTRPIANPAGHVLPSPLPILTEGLETVDAAPSATVSAPEGATAVASAPASVTVKAGDVDAAAKARIDAQQNMLRTAGIEGIGHKASGGSGEQFYTNGTRMMVEGYDTQSRRATEHAALVPFRRAAEELRSRVQDEKRLDVTLTAREFGRSVHANGKLTAGGFVLSEQAIRGVIARIESSAIGHLLGLRERANETRRLENEKPEGKRDFRAVTADRAEMARIITYECERAGDVKIKLRTREGVGDIFAIVSPSYAAADAPQVIPDILAAMPGDARGSWSYDPVSTRWELTAAIWTPTPVAEQAVGEAFRGYTTLGSKDNGAGKFRGGGGIELLRCLNASTYNAASGDVSRRHIGRIMTDVERMIAGGLKAIEALTQAWGRNRAEEIALPIVNEKKVTINDAIPGFWRWLLRDQSSELQGVLPGRSEAHVAELTKAFASERRDSSKLVRSDFAQGWTRYIQGSSTDVRRDAESAIGTWLVSGSKLGYKA